MDFYDADDLDDAERICNASGFPDPVRLAAEIAHDRRIAAERPYDALAQSSVALLNLVLRRLPPSTAANRAPELGF